MKWLHISDLHYNLMNDGNWEGRNTKELRDKLPKFLAQNEIAADELFITGDYRSANLQKDTDERTAARASADFIMEIAESIKLSANHIHIVPGNHDLNRENPSRLNKILKKYNSDDGTFSNDIPNRCCGEEEQQALSTPGFGIPAGWEAGNKGDKDFLLSRFSFFRYLSQYLYKNTETWQYNLQPLHHVYNCGGYSVLCLNTAIACGMDKERGNIVIGNNYLYDALKKAEKIKDSPIIVLAHHSPEFFRADELRVVERLLREYSVKIYLCGDAHKVWFRKMGSIVEITMGCIKSAGDVTVAFSAGEILNDKIKSLSAYSWDKDIGNWAEYKHFNDEFQKSILNSQGDIRQSNSEDATHKTAGKQNIPKAVFPKSAHGITIQRAENVAISKGKYSTQNNTFN